MNLWDMCRKESESLDQLQEIIKNHPDEVLQYTLKTVQEWKKVISDLCETGKKEVFNIFVAVIFVCNCLVTVQLKNYHYM